MPTPTLFSGPPNRARRFTGAEVVAVILAGAVAAFSVGEGQGPELRSPVGEVNGVTVELVSPVGGDVESALREHLRRAQEIKSHADK